MPSTSTNCTLPCALLALAVILALVDRPSPFPMIVALGGVMAFGWHLVWQLRLLDIANPANCLRLFRSNRDAGLIVALFLAASATL